MNAQQLKNSILQEAIEGRLVPQDPNDEPASVLLDKIRKEKARLVKEGKLKKKDLEEKPISEDEKSFEIPESWKWVKLGTIATLIGGFAFKSHEYTSTGCRVIRISDISEGGFIEKNVVRYPFNEKLNSYVINRGDILMAMTGGTVGKSLYVRTLPEEGMLLNQRVANIRINAIFTDYVDYVIKSQHIQSIITDAKNSTNDNISMADIYNFPIPLPPLAEQKRIVAKIEELLPKVEAYGKAQESLDKLNEELPERLKKSILQEAIEGRLVPQDPNDEPASVLLDKIRKEKAKLVKEGKLKKKDLVETPISEDEKPLVLPKNWEWVRLIDIGFFLSGQTPKPAELESTGDVPYFKVSDMNTKGNERFMNITSLYLKKNSKYKTFPKNSIIYPKNGGALLTNKKRILVRDSLVDLNTGAFVPSKELYFEYIYCLFSTIDFRKHFKGTALPTVDMESINRKIVPLPPLAEQKRIVEKLEQLLHEIDKLKTK